METRALETGDKWAVIPVIQQVVGLGTVIQNIYKLAVALFEIYSNSNNFSVNEKEWAVEFAFQKIKAKEYAWFIGVGFMRMIPLFATFNYFYLKNQNHYLPDPGTIDLELDD